MKYVPVCSALSVAILYIVMAAPPSLLSKLACAVLGLVLLYFGKRALDHNAYETLRANAGMTEKEESLGQSDA
jgi:hypothetical protein